MRSSGKLWIIASAVVVLAVVMAFPQVRQTVQSGVGGLSFQKPSSMTVQDWAASWQKRLPVEASVHSGYQYGGGGFAQQTTTKTYTVKLTLQNKTGSAMAVGDDLYLLEASSAPLGYSTGSLTTPIGGFAGLPEPPVNYAAAAYLRSDKAAPTFEYPYGVFEWRSPTSGGSVYSPSNTVVTISSYSSYLVPCAGSPRSANEKADKDTFSLLQTVNLPVRVKENAKPYVVSPPLSFSSGNRHVTFRYILSFDKEDAPPKEVALLPITADGLLPLISNTANPQWQQVFGLYWAGQAASQESEKLMLGLMEKSTPTALRIGALAGLGLGKRTAAVDRISAVANDRAEDSEIRRTAVRALGLIGDPKAKQTILDLLNDKDQALVREAIGAIGDLKAKDQLDHLFQMLAEKSPYGAFYWGDRVTQLKIASGKLVDDSNVDYLIQKAKQGKGEVPYAAIGALLKLDSAASLTALNQLFEGADNTQRWVIVTGLGSSDRPEALAMLTKALDDKQEQVHRTAAQSIGARITGERKLLLLTLVNHRNATVQREAINALSRDRVPEAKAPILGTIAKPELAGTAARALACYDGAETVDTLTKLIEHPDAMLRSDAIDSLAYLKSKSSVTVIASKLQDSEDRVVSSAARALGSLVDPKQCSALVEAFIQRPGKGSSSDLVDSVERLKCSDRSAFPKVLDLLNEKTYSNQSYSQEIVRLLKLISGRDYGPGDWFDYPKKLQESKKKWSEWWQNGGK